MGADYEVEYEEENQLHIKKQGASVYFKFYSDDTGKIIKTEYNNPYVLNSLDNKIGIIQRLEAGEYNGKTEAEVIEYLYSQALYPCDMVHTSNYASDYLQIQPGKYYRVNIQIEKTSQYDLGYVGTLFFQFDEKGILINSGVEALV